MNKSDSAKRYSVTRSYEGRSAEDRRAERRTHLLEAGIRLIGRDGYAAASLNAICAEAGLTKRYFYESFDSVEALLTEAYAEISADLQHYLIAQIGGQQTPRGMISTGFHAFFAYLQAQPERSRVFLVEAQGIHTLRRELLASGGDISAFLLATTRRFIDDKPLSEPVLAVMAQGAVGAAVFTGRNWMASNYQQPIGELVEGVSEICFAIAQRLAIDLDAEL